MKRIFLLFFFNCASCILHCAFSQAPLVKMWDKRFGGTGSDEVFSVQQTADGGFILGGSSASGINGDKTQPTQGQEDYWIVKTDSLGNKQWDRDFGGAMNDVLYTVRQTRDGGYILGGYSISGASGDKTQPLRGNADYWIVKTDSLGNKEWDKDFGGTDEDGLYSIEQTSDNGFILGGYSYSGIGGDKTEVGWGLYDYWIIKIDSLGNKEWDKDFGGADLDDLYAIHETFGKGFILGGRSLSGISGNKTQANKGLSDYWIIKTDSAGNKLWEKDFGNTDLEMFCTIQQTGDSGFILGGWSHSGVGGDKSVPNWDPTNSTGDYWIVKIDSSGNKEWDRVYGGSNYEELYSLNLTSDKGYLLAGDSYSPMSGNKTENNFGQEQTWIVKIDSGGNKIWDKTILTPGHDETGTALETRDGCYVVTNYPLSGSSNGGYRSQATWSSGFPDFWVIKFCDSTILQSLFTTSPFLCPGTCTDFVNLSFNATSYQWNFFGASPDTSTAVNPQSICYNTPGTYDVQLIATNANGTDTLTLTNYITVYPQPAPQSISQSGDTLFAIAGSSSYQWYFNTNIINGATDYFYVAQASGDYNVVATDANGCEVEAAVFNVVAGMQSTVDSGQLTIFPNPVDNKVKIQKLKVTSETAVEISIYNVMGEKMEIEIPMNVLKDQSSEINVQSLTPGLYYLEITATEKIFRSKFVKK